MARYLSGDVGLVHLSVCTTAVSGWVSTQVLRPLRAEENGPGESKDECAKSQSKSDDGPLNW